GEASVRRIYGDFSRPAMKGWNDRLAALALVPVGALVWVWARGMAPAGDLRAVEVAPNLNLPVHHCAQHSLARTGLAAVLVADGTLFVSLLFGVAFLSVVTPATPPPAAGADTVTSLVGLGVIGIALVLAALVGRLNTRIAAALGLGANLLALAALLWLAFSQMDDPTAHARDALRAAVAGYVGLHVLVAAAMAAFVLDQFRRGEITPQTQGALGAWQMWQHFTTAVALLSALVLVAQVGVS
ncbi:MAG: hypothetical protein ACNA7L_07120, partial [Roseinatronobacter sp.]